MSTLANHPSSDQADDGELIAKPDPFDLDACRVASSLDSFDVGKILTTVPVHKPKRNEFFRVRANDDFVIDGYVLQHESGMDKTTYWVPPSMWDALRDHLLKVRLFTCIDKRSNVFLWPAKLPTDDANVSARSWYRSGLLAAERAKTLWVKIQGNSSISAYDIYSRRRLTSSTRPWPLPAA
jgi:hypothetical protein